MNDLSPEEIDQEVGEIGSHFQNEDDFYGEFQPWLQKKLGIKTMILALVRENLMIPVRV